MQQTARRERLQREVVRSTRRAFEIAETRLREGTVDLITVLNTQLTLFQAQDVLAQARLARLQAVVACSRRWAADGRNPRRTPRAGETPPERPWNAALNRPGAMKSA